MSELPYTADSPQPLRSKESAQGVNSFVFIDPVLVRGQTVTLHAREGTIWATPNGGALRVKHDQHVRWECDQPFSLSFVQLGGSKLPLAPLAGRQDPASGLWQAGVTLHSGEAAPFYEYTISVGELTLDPIVIVDKH